MSKNEWRSYAAARATDRKGTAGRQRQQRLQYLSSHSRLSSLQCVPASMFILKIPFLLELGEANRNPRGWLRQGPRIRSTIIKVKGQGGAQAQTQTRGEVYRLREARDTMRNEVPLIRILSHAPPAAPRSALRSRPPPSQYPSAPHAPHPTHSRQRGASRFLLPWSGPFASCLGVLGTWDAHIGGYVFSPYHHPARVLAARGRSRVARLQRGAAGAMRCAATVPGRRPGGRAKRQKASQLSALREPRGPGLI